jgi:hypothetical protein
MGSAPERSTKLIQKAKNTEKSKGEQNQRFAIKNIIFIARNKDFKNGM